jgi:hypothetical protein
VRRRSAEAVSISDGDLAAYDGSHFGDRLRSVRVDAEKGYAAMRTIGNA